MFEGCSPEPAGRPLEAPGDGVPRWMVAAALPGNAEQNPAYRPTRPPCAIDLHIQLGETTSVRSGSAVNPSTESIASRVRFLRIRPQVAVGVQRLDRTGVTETRLNCLHALPVPDEQTRVVVAKRVKPGPGRESCRLDRCAPTCARTPTE